MSIPAVLRTHEQLTVLVQKLVEQGVLKKKRHLYDALNAVSAFENLQLIML